MSEATHIESHHYDCQNMSGTRTTAGVSKWIRKGHKATALNKELQATEEYKEGRNRFSQRRAPQLVTQEQMLNHKNTHK